MEENKKGWFASNWKWIIPTGGCLSIIVVIVLLAGAMLSKVTTLFEDSTPYQEAMNTLKNNIEIMEVLGEPIEVDGMVKGSINYENDKGDASFKIPLKGSKEKAIYTVIANKEKDTWTYQLLQVEVEQLELEFHLIKSDIDLE